MRAWRSPRSLLAVAALLLVMASTIVAAHPPQPETVDEAPTSTPYPNTLRLNELYVAPSPGTHEWVELTNVSTLPLSLAGWTLDDVSDGGALPYSLPSDISVAPDELLMLETPDLFDNFGFDEVRLIDPHGIEVDRFAYMAPARGTSFGRIPDRIGDWQAGLDPTPGALNDS